MLLPGHLDYLHGALAPLRQLSEGPNSTHCPSDCASPCAWESSEGVVSRQGGLLRALISAGFSGSSCNLLPRLSPRPSLRQCAFVCLWGYHHEKKGFRL